MVSAYWSRGQLQITQGRGYPCDWGAHFQIIKGSLRLDDPTSDVCPHLVSPGGWTDDRFRLCGNKVNYVAGCVVLATGLNDVRPDQPLPRTGKGLHYCLHCDAHLFTDESPTRVAVSVGVRGDEFYIDICDNGPGIPPAEIEPIQSGEESALSHGTGVGLWIIDRVVRYSGGDVAFESNDRGTTVSMRFDAAIIGE